MKRKSILFVLVIMGLAVTLTFNDLQENNVDNNIGIERNSIQNNNAEEKNDTEIATDNNEFTLNNDFISSSRHEAFNEEIDTENKKVEEQNDALVSDKTSTYYMPTINNGYIMRYNEETGTFDEEKGYTYGTELRINADIPDGYVFNYWEDGEGNILSYRRAFYVNVMENSIFTAVYSEEEITPVPVIRFKNEKSIVDSENYNILYKIYSEIPENYTRVESGVLVTPDNYELIIGGEGRISKFTGESFPDTPMVNYTYTANLKQKHFDENWTIRARAYVIVQDENGVESTLYSEVIENQLTGTAKLNKAMINYIKDTETIYQEELEAGNQMSLPMDKVTDDTKELVGWKIGDVLYKGGYDSTEFVNSDGVSLQEAVTTMINEGQETIDIVAEYVDKTELNKILDKVSKLVETDYSSASWQALQKAVAELDNLTKQSEIDSKITEIQNAIDNLRVDVSKLDELLERIENMNKDVYTKDTLDNLMKVVDSVEEYTKQYEVDEKVAELEEALKNLKLDPDKVQIQKGDLDRNGIVNVNDAAIALDLYKYGNVSDEELLIGDMDNNGIINANDAALILDIYKYGK